MTHQATLEALRSQLTRLAGRTVPLTLRGRELCIEIEDARNLAAELSRVGHDEQIAYWAGEIHKAFLAGRGEGREEARAQCQTER